MRLTLLKWYFYSIIKIQKLLIVNRMSNKIHYTDNMCNIKETMKQRWSSFNISSSTNPDKVNCSKCLKIMTNE